MHEKYIKRCFYLAQLGEGYVSPNPMVGGVLVYNDEIIGEGYHKQFGEAHAEVNCINSVAENHKKNIEHSTLYINLEPCNHYGKTPPCTDLILKHKIKNVVISNIDNHDLVAGKGIQKLLDNGVNVIHGILKEQGELLNKRFFISNKLQRPYIILKWAESKDGFIGKENERIQISGETSQIIAHQLRKLSDAILVGKNTVLSDNPSLTTRLVTGKNPDRIIWSNSWNEIHSNFKIFDTQAKTYITKDFKLNTMTEILKKIYALNYGILLIEGGAKTINYFIENNLWNEAIVFQSKNKMLLNGISAPIISGKYIDSRTENNSDFILQYSNY